MKVVIIFLAFCSSLAALSRDAKICLFVPEKFVAEATAKCFKNEGYTNVIDDGVQLEELSDYFAEVRPDIVIVDGSGLGSVDRQLEYESKVIALSDRVEKLLLLSSFDIYCKQPFPYKESMLDDRALQNAKNPFAIAKLSCLSKCHALNDPQKRKYILCVYPYLYGANDPKNRAKTDHPVYVITDRILSAKNENRAFTVIPNNGEASYDILHIDDFAKALLYIAEAPYGHEVINISTGIDQSTDILAALVKQGSGYGGEVILDINCYDPVERRLLEPRRIMELGWTPTVSLPKGLKEACVR